MTTLGLIPASKPLRSSAPFSGQTISHPPYLPDLAPSDFHLFGPLKENLREQCFFSDEVIKTAVKKWFKTQPVEFYNEGVCAILKRWEKAVRKARDYIEK